MAKMYIQTVTGSFEDDGRLEDARDYLLANGFDESELHSKPGGLLTIFAASIVEAQEAIDVLRNYGAINISAPDVV
jgi:hypothetical protein